MEKNPAQALSLLIELEKQVQNPYIDSLDYRVKMKKANALERMDLFDQSIDIWFALLSKYKKMEDAAKVAVISDEIGGHFFATGQYKEALDLYYSAKQLCIDKRNFADTLKLNMEIGLNLAGTGDFDQSIRILEHNIDSAKRLGNKKAWVHGVDNLANVYHELGEYEKALEYQHVLLNSDEAKASDYLKMALFQHITELNIELGRYQTAQKYLDSAFHYGSVINSKEWLFDFHKNQYQIYKASGRYKDALVHHEMFRTLKDSVFNVGFQNKFTGLSSLYELEQKQNKIELLDAQNALAKVRIERLTLAVIITILLAVIVSLWLRYRHKKLDKLRQERFSQTLLQAQEDERIRIAKELHDSIGQNILFIKNKVRKLFEESETELSYSIDQTLENVRNISKELYPAHLDKLGLEKSVELLARQVTEEFGIFVSSDLTGIDKTADKDLKINIFRIIQEFINNSLKHAGASAVRVTSEIGGKYFHILLQDNGVGFDLEQVRNRNNPSVGLYSIEERVKIFKGRIVMQSSQHEGTRFSIQIPL